MPEQLTFDAPTLEDIIAELIRLHGYSAVMGEVRRQVPRLSVASAPARIGDPETSHRAAKTSPDVSRFSQRSLAARLLHKFAIEPMTDQAATIRVIGQMAAPSAFDGCRRRCSDLRAAGYLYDTGKRAVNIGSNDESIVWTVSRVGRIAIENLDDTGWSR